MARMAAVAALVLGMMAAFIAPASAAQVQQAPVPIGPECQSNVVAAVLTRLAEIGTPLVKGQKIQYLEVYTAPSGVPSIRPCVVTVPN